MKKSTSNNQPRHFRTIGLLLLCSLVYFVLLIFPNATGAQNPEMLSIFEVDEYAQYEHAVRMVSGSDSLLGSLRNFVAYQHYFYGYPFYLFSAVVLLPLRLLFGSGWVEHTSLIVLVLRQLINVLPNLLAVWLLTYAATEFKSSFKTISLFILMLALPGLVGNSLWWHADALGLMFMALVFFCLRKDSLYFGRYFWLAAAATGVALGIKYVGALFGLTIPTYLLLGLRSQRQNLPRALRTGALFLALMLTVFVLTNPLLLLPQERAELIANQQLQFEQTSQGILVGRPDFLQDGRLPAWLTGNYGMPVFLGLLAAALLAGWLQPGHCPQAAILSAWLLPNLLVAYNASSFRPHYWLPVFLPALTALTFVLPEQPAQWLRRPLTSKALTGMVVLLVLLVQAGLFVRQDVLQYTEVLQREATSPSLEFYRSTQARLAALPAEAPLRIYRDWKVYYPSQPTMDVFFDWELGSHDMLQAQQPDVLLLERENVQAYGAEDYLETAPDPERLLGIHLFYRDALLNQLAGYELVYEDGFGLMFIHQ